MDRKASRCKFLIAGLFLIGISLSTACAPVGSEAWCRKMKNKAKGDWTANEASDYAKHCLFR